MFCNFVWMELLTGTVPVNKLLLAGTVPYVWLVHTHTWGGGVQTRLSFFSLLYGTPAPSAERQHPEAWPASTYGHLRGVSLKTVPEQFPQITSFLA